MATPDPTSRQVSGPPLPEHISDTRFEIAVERQAYGEASRDEQTVLDADRARWTRSLLHRIAEVEDALDRLRGRLDDRDWQVVEDLDDEHRHLSAAYARLTGDASVLDMDVTDAGLGHPAVPLIQLSWEPGKVVAWAAGPTVGATDAERLTEMLGAAGANPSTWSRHSAVRLPDGVSAPALVVAAGDALGWLVALGADESDNDLVGPGARWLGQVAAWAVELCANGSMVPLLRQRRRNRNSSSDPSMSSFSARWTPALVATDRFDELAATMPGSVTAVSPSTDGREVVKSALTGLIDAICRRAAAMIDVPAPPPEVHNARDAAETFLARLDGTHFDAPNQVGNELVGRLDRWARPLVNGVPGRLVVQLDPPDSSNAWHLIVLAPDPDDQLVSVEVALVNAGPKRREYEDQLVRLERMLPVLLRPGSNRRGEVMLSQEEAWELMSRTGADLASAGYDVRVPALSRKAATPSLRLTSEQTTSVVGANQLAEVRWSAVFDGVELTASEIADLAKQARPLVRSGGRWVAIDHADLASAAAALAERGRHPAHRCGDVAPGARHRGAQLSGGISIAGSSWASDLLEAAGAVAGLDVGAPEGFDGELRSYQAEALGWLGFLEEAGLGGCLALDMGLGKTPTMLAHLLAEAGDGPALVIAPPAVVGNWASEAARFTPKLKVVVHHGASRASVDQIAGEASTADVVITTYGTAVRDIDAIEDIGWSRLVLDEAQAIKNPANDTSQQLRRIQARTKLALTGTPIENGLGDLWALLDFTNPGLVGPRAAFIAQMSAGGGTAKARGEDALRALNGIMVFRRTKAEPAIAAELPDRVDTLDHCSMTPEQIGLYQAVLDRLVTHGSEDADPRKGEVLAAITALKQICNHPAAYQDDGRPLTGRSGKLDRLEEIVGSVFAADEKVLVFTHFAEWGTKMAAHLGTLTGTPVHCYHGGLSRTARDEMIAEFQGTEGAAALVLSLKAGGTGLNLTAASHVVLYDRWWNPAVEDQARDRAWRLGQTRTVICHRLVCPGTVDEKVEEVVQDKRRIADLVLPKSSSLADLDADQLRQALGLRPEAILTESAELLRDEHERRNIASDLVDASEGWVS
ncbi:MAG: DEAD/DEAH box helicase [Microthrixaceae bacterium]